MIKRIFASDDTGATSVEYGLIAALIAGVIVLAVGALGQQAFALFTTLVWP